MLKLSLVIKQFDIDSRKPTKILTAGKNVHGKQAVKTIDSPAEGRKESIFQRRDCVTETGAHQEIFTPTLRVVSV